MLKGLSVAQDIFGLCGDGVYCLFAAAAAAAAAAAVVSFPVEENAFFDRDVFVLGVILEIHLHFSEHSTQTRV